MTRTEFENQWNGDFANLPPLAGVPMPSYDEFRICERMLEDYLDIFRGFNSREGEMGMPYPHPFFDSNGNPLLDKKPCIHFILIGEARPPLNTPVLNNCMGDRANTYFYDIRHIKHTSYLSAPRANWGCPIERPCPNNKVNTLLCLASKGVLLLDLFPFAITYSTALREDLNTHGVTSSFWNDSRNPYNMQDRIRSIANLLCDNWDLTMVAPCKISEHIVNPVNGFGTLGIIPIGLHPTTFRTMLYDANRCNGCNFGHEWKKIAVGFRGAPSARLIGLSF
jgi:hypothetical protein